MLSLQLRPGQFLDCDDDDDDDDDDDESLIDFNEILFREIV